MGSLFSEQVTWLHHVPVGYKLLAVGLLGTGLLWLTDTTLILLACASVLVLLISLGRLPPQARRALRSMALASLLILGFHAVLGQALTGLLSGARLFTASSLGLALTLTTRHADLLTVLETTLQPLRRLGIRSDRLALQVSLMLRFTEHFFVQWQRLNDAHRVRTGRSGGWRLIAPLTIHMLETARRVADTLQLRLGP